jgi:hypothetical protein
LLLCACAATFVHAQSPGPLRRAGAAGEPRLLPGGIAAPAREVPAAPATATATSGVVGARAAVRIAGASAGGLQFEVEVPAAEITVIESHPEFGAISIDGYQTLGRSGEPALPRRVVFVAVPPQGEVRVRSIGLEATRHAAVRLAPEPHSAPDAPQVRLYGALPQAYASAADVAPERARLLGVSWMRNQRVAEIEILPAAYVPASGALTVYGRVAVTVEFRGSAPAPGAEPATVDAFERVYASTLVNYEQGRAWRRPATRDRAARSAAIDGAVVPDTSVFAGRTWVKLSIPRTGFYRVNYAQLRLLPEFGDATATPLDSLRLFTWPGFPVLPEDTYCDSCDFREVAISVVDGAAGDGAFDDNDDYVEFFAMGPSDWADLYDATRPDTVFINNPYETLSYYYLTFGTAELPVGGTPQRYGQRSGQIVNPSATTPATFDARRHFELDLEYFPDPTSRAGFLQLNTLFWEKWYWRSLSQGQSFVVPFDLPKADAGQPGRLRASAWGITYTKPSRFVPFCVVGDHGALFGLNSVPAVPRYWRMNTGHVLDTTLAAGDLTETGNRFTLSSLALPCVNFSHRVALAWFDVFFQQRLEAIDDTLTFDSPLAPGDYIHRITGFSSPTPPRVFDVTDAYAPVEIADLEYADSGSGWVLRFQGQEPGRRRYRVIQPRSVDELKPTSVRSALATSTQNLRSASREADYLVIYYDAFKQAADSLLAWRTQHLPLLGGVPPYKTLGVPISALFDQFSGGRTDPAAIRNFLRAAYSTWQRPPAFVTFLGDASHDFKNYLGRALSGDPGSLLTSYEGGFDPSVSVERQYATDDWLLNVDDATRIIPDFFGGRIPAVDLASANTYVRSKLFAHERSTLFGNHRNRFMLIADDDKQGESDDALRWTHVSQTSELDSGYTATHIDRAYVYLHKFPDGPGATKPGAKQAIIEGVNQGVSVLNYVGHGSPFKMADESVFLDTDTGALNNADRLTVFVAASCDIGKFNDPTVPSIGERLLLEAKGGAVGVISATELALSNQNAQLNRVLYAGIFDRTRLLGPYGVGFAEALLAAKLGSTTTQKYQLMGDSGLTPNLPGLWAEFTLWDSAGTTPVTEAAHGRTVTLRGQILDAPGGAPITLDGVGSLLIEDSAPYEQAPICTFAEVPGAPACPPLSRPYYYYSAAPMFRGDVAVRGGTFESRFVVPLEGKLGARGRVRMYFEGRASGAGASTDGVGATRLQISPGTAPAGDSEGPRITLSFPGGATSVKPDAVLTIGLSDPSGILTTGHTLQNGIIVTVDDNTTARVDVTSSFRYAADSYQNGTATFQLPNLAPGPHKVRISAADNLAAGFEAAAHRSSAELAFEVQEAPALRIARAYLFPNPMRSGGSGSGGQFVVDTPGDSVNVLIRIYTVSGRQVKALRAFGGLGQVQLPWDGRDSEGYELANGVYFYRVHVNPRGEDGESDAARKATADGRIVVVGH